MQEKPIFLLKDASMSHLILPKGWNSPERDITPEHIYQNRREFLQLMGLAAGGIAGALMPSSVSAADDLLGFFDSKDSQQPHLPSIIWLERNLEYQVNRPITYETVAQKYNNFYEFTSVKEKVWKEVNEFKTRPWQITIDGLVTHPLKMDVDELIKLMPLEERIYRHRCVETWAMVAPWSGFPMEALIKKVEPSSKAKYVKFTSFLDPEIAPGQNSVTPQPWPYTEALTLQEANNELTFLSTGIYGRLQLPQHGAPIRLVAPWKYGFMGIKSIVRIEFHRDQTGHLLEHADSQ